MTKYIVKQSKLSGDINAPPSKSHTLRAIFFARFANGQSTIKNYLHSPDTDAMISACKQLGAKIEIEQNQLRIDGMNGKPQCPENVIDAGNSGQVLRFISAITALQSGYVVITGDHSIRHNRPMQPFIDGITGLGAFCVSTKNDGFAPMIIKGPMKPGKTTLSGEDSQPVSALLMATPFLNGPSEILVKNPGEKPWIDLTLSWLKKLNIHYKNNDYKHYIISGNARYPGFNYIVPGDFSSILFPIAAALVTQSEITIHFVDMNDVQGDKKVIAILKAMGAEFEYDANTLSLTVKQTKTLTGMEIDANDFIDAVPILAVIGCFASGKTIIKNASIARSKECDRISAITKELKKMGAIIEEYPDGLIVEHSHLKGTKVNTYHDHRMVMSLFVAGLFSKGKTIIDDSRSISKSYPTFYEDMKKLGANYGE